jgi:hypothetical protein
MFYIVRTASCLPLHRSILAQVLEQLSPEVSPPFPDDGMEALQSTKEGAEL